MKARELSVVVVFALLIFAGFSGLASAHHSIAGYDNQESELRGTVVEYIWRNPHVLVRLEVKDQTGKVVEWSAETASPTTMIQNGMSRNSMKRGDEVVLTVRRSKTGNPLAVIRKIMTADGKVIADRLAPN